MQTSPIFLVGAERSGTTLLRLMLDSHPQIAFEFEFEFVVDQINAEGHWPPLADYYEYLSTHRIFQLTSFTIDKNLSYDELVRSFLVQKQQKDSKPLVGATVHHNFVHLPKIWPNARYIHIVRDGRDVARSNVDMGWSGLPYFGVERWITAEGHWQNLSALVPKECCLTIYYENLVSNPDAVLQTICEFIGVAFDNAMYSYAQHTPYDKPSAKFTEQWREKMSEDQIRLVEGRVADLLEKHGYALSGLPPRQPSALELRWLHWIDRLKHIQYRLRYYPLNVYIQEMVARRLGFKKWQKHMRLKLNEYENSQLR